MVQEEVEQRRVVHSICRGYVLSTPEDFVPICRRIVEKYRDIVIPSTEDEQDLPPDIVPLLPNEAKGVPVSYCAPDVVFKYDILSDGLGSLPKSVKKSRCAAVPSSTV
jgi:hypothetical protein